MNDVPPPRSEHPGTRTPTDRPFGCGPVVLGLLAVLALGGALLVMGCPMLRG